MSKFNLIEKVIENSQNKTWQEAKEEWVISGLFIDNEQTYNCICGKHSIKYCYSIMNVNTGIILSPIGSDCITKFESKKLNEELIIQQQLQALHTAIMNRETLDLNVHFSRKLIEFMFDNDVFRASKYNNFDGEKDYEFLLTAFNSLARKKSRMTVNQKRKVTAIILSQIVPYMKSNDWRTIPIKMLHK